MDSDPVAIITGASSGIGLAIARGLSQAGYRLVLAARHPDRLREAAASIGGNALAIPTDMGRLDQVDRLIDGTMEHFGRIDVLVNNAGFAPLLPIAESTGTTLTAAFQVNAIGPAHAIARCWPHFIAASRGCVVNISTLGTSDPFPGFFAYAASKAAVNLLARSCAVEGAEHGVRAFSIAPGAVETPMLRGLFGPDQIPADACLTPDEVAARVVACIRGDHDDQNGNTIFMQR